MAYVLHEEERTSKRRAINGLHLCEAAIDKQFRSRDVAAVVGCEKHHGLFLDRQSRRHAKAVRTDSACFQANPKPDQLQARRLTVPPVEACPAHILLLLCMCLSREPPLFIYLCPQSTLRRLLFVSSAALSTRR